MAQLDSVLITGANRGLGLAFVRELLLLKPHHLIACCRDPETAEELQKLKKENANLHVLQLDVANFDQYDEFVKLVQHILDQTGLQLIINNAGTYHRNTLDQVRPEIMIEEFRVNVAAPVELTRLLWPLLKQWSVRSGGRKATVANISSERGSLALNVTGGRYSYASSKAALNQVTRSLAVDLQPEAQAMALHPGWVKTDMGGPNAEITADQSIPKIVKLLTGQLNIELNGKFLNYDGLPMPW